LRVKRSSHDQPSVTRHLAGSLYQAISFSSSGGAKDSSSEIGNTSTDKPRNLRSSGEIARPKAWRNIFSRRLCCSMSTGFFTVDCDCSPAAKVASTMVTTSATQGGWPFPLPHRIRDPSCRNQKARQRRARCEKASFSIQQSRSCAWQTHSSSQGLCVPQRP
jgi:hypothetical protein